MFTYLTSIPSMNNLLQSDILFSGHQGNLLLVPVKGTLDASRQGYASPDPSAPPPVQMNFDHAGRVGHGCINTFQVTHRRGNIY